MHYDLLQAMVSDAEGQVNTQLQVVKPVICLKMLSSMLLVWISKLGQYILQMHVQTDVDSCSTANIDCDPFAKFRFNLSEPLRLSVCSLNKYFGKMHTLLNFFALKYELDA